jgi:outer membrane beta-barrel protein
MKPYIYTIGIFAALSTMTLVSAAEKQVAKPSASDSATSPAPGQAERVDVDNIKEKYWARGEEAELGVVQNRLYSKTNKIELGLSLGTTNSDPFITTRNLGLNVGYNFSEYIAVRLNSWYSFSNSSSALVTLNESGKEANTNPTMGYVGAEVNWNLLYGKLSLLGKKIIYYDLFLTAGVGVTLTRATVGANIYMDRYITPHLGIGQQIYLSRHAAFRMDYKAMYYRETLIEHVITARLGEAIGQRDNFSHVISLGVNFFFGAESK